MGRCSCLELLAVIVVVAAKNHKETERAEKVEHWIMKADCYIRYCRVIVVVLSWRSRKIAAAALLGNRKMMSWN